MNLKVGIVDDEMSVCSTMESYVTDHCKKNNIPLECETWTDCWSFLKDMEKGFVPDILFLDIEMPHIDGISAGNYIRENVDNQIMQIVYISSKTNYAMELFHIHPYDFLVKPITCERVKTILNKLIKNLELDRQLYRVSYKGEERGIPWGEISYIESNDKHLEVHLISGESVVFVGKIKSELAKMPYSFVRVNQSYIVNLKYVKSYKYDELVLTDETELSVSSPYRKEMKSRFISYLEGDTVDVDPV